MSFNYDSGNPADIETITFNQIKNLNTSKRRSEEEGL